jgi:hypothetical protein
MRSIPAWFIRDLKLIEPEIRIEYSEKLNHFIFWKMLPFKLTGKEEPIIIGTYKELNDKTLEEIRHRQWIRRNKVPPGDVKALLRFYKQEERRTKEKLKEAAIEQIAEGLTRIYRQGRRKIFT